MPQNFELQTICVILMVNENWFHSNIGCGAEFNLFAGFVYLFNFPISIRGFSSSAKINTKYQS